MNFHLTTVSTMCVIFKHEIIDVVSVIIFSTIWDAIRSVDLSLVKMMYHMVPELFIMYRYILFHLSHTEYQLKSLSESWLKHSAGTIFLTTCRKSMISSHRCGVLSVVDFLTFGVWGDWADDVSSFMVRQGCFLSSPACVRVAVFVIGWIVVIVVWWQNPLFRS